MQIKIAWVKKLRYLLVFFLSLKFFWSITIYFTFSQIPKWGYFILGNIHNTIHRWCEKWGGEKWKILKIFFPSQFFNSNFITSCTAMHSLNVSFKWTSAITRDLALVKAKRTHYFGFLNGNHNFQLESRSEKMKMDGLS